VNNDMSDKRSEVRLPDPKIVPPPEERADMVIGDRATRRAINKRFPNSGCWSKGEYCRMVIREFIRRYHSMNPKALTDDSPP
jgi:hypothetical protein